MGTTLTGTTPQDTYDSLIKVTDNAPLTGSLKVLTDGLGNDSALALSTTAVGIGTTSSSLFGTTGFGRVLGVVASSNYAVVQVGGGAGSGGEIDLGAGSIRQGAVASLDGSSLAFYTNPTNAGNGLTERMLITSAGNVGIGTSAPDTKLQVAGTGGTGFSIRANTSGDAFMRYYLDTVIASDAYVDRSTGNLNIRTNQNSSAIVFSTSAALIERVRITDNGLTFNGDTAAANALDDYEEGTFTPSIAFGGGSTGITYFDRVGNYTKIGRQVTCTIYVAMTAIGSSTGAATLTGLPFTASGLNRGIATAASIRFDNITYTGTLSLLGGQSGNTLAFGQTTEAGVDSLLTNANFNGDSEMVITVTYFV